MSRHMRQAGGLAALQTKPGQPWLLLTALLVVIVECCLPQLRTYSEPLHQLQAITQSNLKFDLLDCMQMT